MNAKDCQGAGRESTPTFAEVKAILDHLVYGKEDLLEVYHGDSLKWTTADQLRKAVVRRREGVFPLIEAEFVGNCKGLETLLVRILTDEVTINGRKYPRMPHRGNINGEYATTDQLDRIARWIDAGCPE